MVSCGDRSYSGTRESTESAAYVSRQQFCDQYVVSVCSRTFLHIFICTRVRSTRVKVYMPLHSAGDWLKATTTSS